MMNRITSLGALTLLALASPFTALAASTRVGLTARLADSGTPMTGNHDVHIQLFDVPTGGSALWGEPHGQVAVTNGVLHVPLGNNTPLDDGIFNGAPLYLEMAVDGTTLSPRLEVLPVPYAIRAQTAARALTAANADNATAAQTASTADTASTLGTLTPSDVQRRISVGCSTGSFMQAVDFNGAVACGGYNAGFGLSLAGQTLSVNQTAVQSRVTGTCTSGQAMTAISQTGTPTCSSVGTSYSAGSGLSLTGTTFTTDNTVVARKDVAAGSQTFGNSTLHIDYVNSRVGVGTTITSQSKLDVNGDVRAASYNLNPARNRRSFIPGSALVAVSLQAGTPTAHPLWVRGQDGYGYIGSGTAPQIALTAPISVPQGATITQVFCDIYDNSNETLTISAELRRRIFTSLTSEVMAAVTSYQSTGATTTGTRVYDNTVTNAVIDNNSYVYVINVDFANTAWTSNLRLYGCGVDYTQPSL